MVSILIINTPSTQTDGTYSHKHARTYAAIATIRAGDPHGEIVHHEPSGTVLAIRGVRYDPKIWTTRFRDKGAVDIGMTSVGAGGRAERVHITARKYLTSCKA